LAEGLGAAVDVEGKVLPEALQVADLGDGGDCGALFRIADFIE